MPRPGVPARGSVWIAHVCELSSSLPSSGGAWRVAESRWFWVSCVKVCSCLGRVLETPQSSCHHPRFFLSGVQATREGVPHFHSPGCVPGIHTRCPGAGPAAQRSGREP